MTKQRIKIQTLTLQNRDAAEGVMNELATAVNNKRVVTALRDGEVVKINERYEAQLSALDERIDSLTDALRAWAESNPDQFPKGRKSIDMLNGVIGFRTGTPKLALLSRAFNWEKVLELITNNKLWAFAIRVKQEIDKDAILGAHGQAENKEQFTDELKRIGCKVTQDESFFVEPKLTEVETRQVV